MVDTKTANEQGRKFIYTYIYLSPVILVDIDIWWNKYRCYVAERYEKNYFSRWIKRFT